MSDVDSLRSEHTYFYYDDEGEPHPWEGTGIPDDRPRNRLPSDTSNLPARIDGNKEQAHLNSSTTRELTQEEQDRINAAALINANESEFGRIRVLDEKTIDPNRFSSDLTSDIENSDLYNYNLAQLEEAASAAKVNYDNLRNILRANPDSSTSRADEIKAYRYLQTINRVIQRKKTTQNNAPAPGITASNKPQSKTSTSGPVYSESRVTGNTQNYNVNGIKPQAYKVAYTGCDIIPVVHVPGQAPTILGDISGISYSIHRGKTAVRVVGRSYPKSYARGGRTIAGSIVSLVFEQAALMDLVSLYGPELVSDTPMTSLVPDQIPPFDITITYWSEVPGANGEFRGSYLKLFGVEIVDEGQAHSTQDAYPENTMQFVARDIEHLVPVHDVGAGYNELTQSAPFTRALFQNNGGVDPVERNDGQLAALGETVKDIQKEFDAINILINDFENLHTDRSNWTGNDGQEIVSDENTQLNRLYAEYDEIKLRLDKATAEQELERGRVETRQLAPSYKAIVNPYRSIRDNPFDSVTPVRY
jgi:hypothetical protein